METTLDNLKKLTEGLLFISETKHPLEAVSFKNKSAFQYSMPNNIKIETQHIDQFFNNAVKAYQKSSIEEPGITKQYMQLLSFIKEKIENVIVYRCGNVSIQAFILGETEEGNFAGIATTLIET